MSTDFDSAQLADDCAYFAEVLLPDACDKGDVTLADLKAVKHSQDYLECARQTLFNTLSGQGVPVPPQVTPGRDDPRAHRLRNGGWMVASRTQPGVYWRVAGECTCPAGRMGSRCWHARLVQELVKPEPRPPRPTNTAWFE